MTQQPAAERLERENRELRLIVDMYDRLGGLVLQRADVTAITQALAALVSQPVLVLDPLLRLRTSADRDGATLRFWNPTTEYVSRVLQGMAGEARSLRLPPLPDWGVSRGCVIAPVLGGEETLAYVCILEEGGAQPSRDEIELIAAEHAAGVYALALLRERLEIEVTRELRDELLDGLLSGQVTDEGALEERARRLGYDSSAEHRVLLFRAGLEQPEAARRLTEAAVQMLRQRAPESIRRRREGELLAVVSNDGDAPALETARAVVEYVSSLAPESPIACGVSAVCRSAAELGRAYEQARRSADVAARFKRGEVVRFEDLGLYRLLFLVKDRSELKAFVDQTLGALIEYDRRHKSDFVGTLGAYLTNNNNLQTTARELGIHVNTAAYRVQRIQAIGGLDLSKTDDALLARVALMILEDVVPG
jgi:hypothetical protein